MQREIQKPRYSQCQRVYVDRRAHDIHSRVLKLSKVSFIVLKTLEGTSLWQVEVENSLVIGNKFCLKLAGHWE